MVMRYRDGKWQNDVMPEDLIGGGKLYQYAQPVMNSMQGGVSPTYYQTRATEPTAVAAAPTAAAPAAPVATSWSQNQPLSALLTQPTAPSAAVSNPFADRMAGYLNRGAPTAPTTNSFADPLKQYLGAPAPTAEKATMGTNRFAGGLSAAEQRLQELITNPSSLESSSSYKFRVEQGQQALERSLGARGLLNSGNRLTELTKYGQDMGSQEYEAENARRMALLNSYAGNYNTDQANNVNLLGVQQGSLDKQYGTAADLYKARGATLANLYGGEAIAANQRYGTEMDAYGREGATLADLYRGADTTGTQRYATDVGAASDRAKTLADLYRTDTTANVERERTAAGKTGPQPWWVGKYDQYGRPIQ